MAKPRGIKDTILEMRRNGKTYLEIQKELGCSKHTITFHCKKHNLTDIGLKNHPVSKEIALQIFEYCKTHKLREAVEHFKLSESTIKKYKKLGI